MVDSILRFKSLTIWAGVILFFAILIIAFIAFLSGVGREIMKDVMDYKGDKEEGVKSFPKYIGEHKSNIIAGLFYVLAVCLSFIPFLM